MREQWMKRVTLGMALALGLLVLPVSANQAEPTIPEGYQCPFSDVQEGQWFYPYVTALNSIGAIEGYDDGRFGPDDSLRGGDATIMVLKAAGSGTLEPTGSHYASGYTDYAIQHGYLTPEEMGNPEDSMARILVARMAAKALGLKPSTQDSPFVDMDDPYLTALYEQGVVTGSVENGQRVFLPKHPVTRGEISVIVWQVSRVAQEQGTETPEEKPDEKPDDNPNEKPDEEEGQTPPPVEEKPEQIYFMGKYYDVLPGVPVNAYNPEGFSWVGDQITYQDADYRVAAGIDVSVYQGEIDWQMVADSGVEFAIIRAGYRGYGAEGNMRTDSYFHTNMEGAIQAGLDVGVYFFSQAVSAEEARQEAAYVLELIAPYQLTYPVVFDWEHQDVEGSRTQVIPEVDRMGEIINAFCQDIQGAGYQPMVYFYQSLAYGHLDLRQFVQYPFWLAQYTDSPSFYYHFDMWQYTSKGRVPGIAGNVDLNLRFFPVE